VSGGAGAAHIFVEDEAAPARPAAWRRGSVALMLAIAACLFVFHARIYWQWTEDDAFITYRYARNVARGEGFVFNPGERLEGYSNFTWVLLGAVAENAGWDPERTAKSVGLAAGIVALLLSWAVARKAWPQCGLCALLAPYTLAMSPVLAQHAVAGLETSAFAALLAGALLLAASNRRPGAGHSIGLAVVLLLLSLTRPEGALVAGALLVMRWLLLARKDAGAGRHLAGVSVVFILLLTTYIAWRWSYYDAAFPNTFYAKARGGLHGIYDGVQYTLDFTRDSGGPLFVALSLVPVLLGPVPPALWMGLGVLATYLVFIVLAGGDWMYHYRFFAHVLPVLAALIAVGLARMLDLVHAGTWRALAVYATAALVLLVTFMGIGNTELRVARAVLPALASHNYLSQNYEELGLWFAENTAEDATVAISDVGAVGYYSERRILDMFGLIDPRIARLRGRMHYKADPRYVLSREPDYIVLVSLNDQGAGYSFQRIPDYSMNALPAFHEQYELIRTVPQHWNNEFVLVYRRRGA